MQKPSKAPLTGQEVKPPSQDTTYNFVGSESVMEADKGSLESSPSPAMARNVPQEESRRWTTPGSCSSETVMDLNECSQSYREQETVEGDPARKDGFEPSLLTKSQIINIDMKKSQLLRSNANPSLNTKSVDSNSEDVDFDEQFCKLEFQGFTDWLALSQPTCVLLQDCATEQLLKDCHSDIFTAENTLASQASLSCFETLSNRESSNSQILYDVTSNGGSSQGQQEALRGQPQHKSQRRKFVCTDAREANRSPKLGQQRKGLLVQRFYQARRMSHPGQKKQSAESLQSKSHLKKRRVSSENHFRERIKHFLQWVCPSKGKRPEEPLQKCKPASDTAQSHRTVKSRLITDSKAVETQAS